ncbi:hypothetical protein BLS_009677 [Venturia inaequalis]|uniref:Uncharacterized protein n=1 Tax=Venturia inaequalis TaxID=5025 RepID=A0A8H3V3B9_VENIN|nr:hypothetical protein EG328_003563 [Venturia inaequalis]KAE9979579.1 hypothetical protein BLS_009677 [Venturia inaequalis]
MSLPTPTPSHGSAYSSVPPAFYHKGSHFQHFIAQRKDGSITSYSPTESTSATFNPRKRGSSTTDSLRYLENRPPKRSCPDPPLQITIPDRRPFVRVDSGFHSASPVSLASPIKLIPVAPPSPKFWSRPVVKPLNAAIPISQIRFRSPEDEELYQAIRGSYPLPDVTVLSLAIDICQRYTTLDQKLWEWYHRELKPQMGPEHQGIFNVDAKWILVHTTRSVINDWLLDGLYNYEEREWASFGRHEMESWLGPSVRTSAFFRSLILTLWRSHRAHRSMHKQQAWQKEEADIISQTYIPTFSNHITHIRTWISKALDENCQLPVSEMMPDLSVYINEIIATCTKTPNLTSYETRSNGLLALTKISNAIADAEGEVGDMIRNTLLPTIDMVEGMLWIVNCMSSQERAWVREGNFGMAYFHELFSLLDKTKKLGDCKAFDGLWVVVKHIEGLRELERTPILI